ncbi:hypothetical protein OG548_45790 [Streptomyces sp. NBC_01356]|nr:hypothetical protein [Streptomyces sp. NBC_01356]
MLNPEAPSKGSKQTLELLARLPQSLSLTRQGLGTNGFSSQVVVVE